MPHPTPIEVTFTCKACGAVHTAMTAETPLRGRKRQDCLACGLLLVGWKETRGFVDFKRI